MLEILVLTTRGGEARHKYLELVDQLRENNIKYRQNFNRLTLTTENTRTKFACSQKQIQGLKPDIILGEHEKFTLENVMWFDTVVSNDHDPIYYIKQKELD